VLQQVTELWQFFLVRMLTGISVGGCFPLVFSLLGDLFPVSQRAAMAAIVQIAVGGGIGGGQVSKCGGICGGCNQSSRLQHRVSGLGSSHWLWIEELSASCCCILFQGDVTV
jgi:MFS family permease